jgi:hypothetical protein
VAAARAFSSVDAGDRILAVANFPLGAAILWLRCTRSVAVSAVPPTIRCSRVGPWRNGHFDGAKDEQATILVWGEGPATSTQVPAAGGK